jgi:multidrug efflux system membrane fusion protein
MSTKPDTKLEMKPEVKPQTTNEPGKARPGRDHPDAAPTPESSRSSHRGRWVVGLIVAALLIGVGVRRWRAHQAESSSSAATAAKAGADRPVPVLVATATARDVPIYLEGLGSVVAFKTVNVRTQVDGRLIRVDFREGQAVRRGDLLAEVDPRPFTIQLHQGEAALARDEAQLHGAEKNLERYAAVSAERLIPEQQTDDQRALVDQLRGTVENDRAQIESARLMLDFARITSPIDGITGVRQVDAGNIIHVADANTNGIVVVTQMDPIAIIFTLPQDDLPQVVAQQAKGALTVEAMGRDGNLTLAKGTLSVIDNQINQATATMRLKAIFPNPDKALWPNQFVRTRLLVDVRKNVLVVPAVAVQRGPQGTFVYVMSDDGHALQRPVTLASTEGDQALLSEGITAGTKVVIEGQAQLRAGSAVVVRGGSSQGAGAGAGGGARRRQHGGAGGASGAEVPGSAKPGAGSVFRGPGGPAKATPQ